MLVFLVGFMACGKSTLGSRIAQALNWHFIDLDKFIGKSKKQSVTEIFAQEGEDKFRQYENDALNEIIKQPGDIVISTGGGTPCYNDNMNLMNEFGITIYLKTGFGVLTKRLKDSKKKRPLIENMTEPELHTYILKKLSQREPFYKQAKYHANTNNLQLKDILNIIKSEINIDKT